MDRRKQWDDAVERSGMMTRRREEMDAKKRETPEEEKKRKLAAFRRWQELIVKDLRLPRR